ncbi:PadR family transcriptional regulator [Alkanindiges sp. WGS2144]|uniref:PadR family transcriptional regulator n=1 Tax=Alkanindiges sp. WGS2144 TaxID=3366808 RepID=UPI0037539220
MSKPMIAQASKQRGFGHGGLRLVLLTLIDQQPSHGYELIKAIEALTAGHYRPSAGMVYPLLNQLVEQGFIVSQAGSSLESKKQVYAITSAGQQLLQQEAERLEHILTRVRQRARQPVSVTRAIENFKLAVRLKLSEQVLSAEQAMGLAEILDETARKIEQL